MLARNPEALWDAIPSNLHGGIARWLIHGVEPGSFLRAALYDGGLAEAAARADERSFAALGAIGLFTHLYFPSEAQDRDEWKRGGYVTDAKRWGKIELSFELYPYFLDVLKEATKL